MQIFFDHIAGNITNRELVYSPATAIFEEQEFDFAFENGWHIAESWGVDDFDWYNKQRNEGKVVWYQARSTRLDVSAYEERKRHRKKIRRAGVECEVHTDVNEISDSLYTVYKKYIASKKFTDFYESAEDLFDGKLGERVFLVFTHDGKIIGFSILDLVSEKTAMAPQFAWDYENPQIGLGYVSKLYQLRYLQERSIKYLYLGNSYEMPSLGKSDLPGFEWWDGRKWSSDIDLYKHLIVQESRIQTLDELYNLQQKYYSRHV